LPGTLWCGFGRRIGQLRSLHRALGVEPVLDRVTVAPAARFPQAIGQLANRPHIQ
jgi:hypothetical protein